jgi:hypothetical protein
MKCFSVACGHQTVYYPGMEFFASTFPSKCPSKALRVARILISYEVGRAAVRKRVDIVSWLPLTARP